MQNWKPYLCSFKSPEGEFSFTIYATSMDHAAVLLADLRDSAKLDGELKETIRLPSD